MRLAAYANRKQKYVVTTIVASVLLARRFDPESCVCVCGAIANAALCRVLKNVIRQKRPASQFSSKAAAGAEQPDEDDLRDGMPSSHAASLIFLATYVAAAVFATAPTVAWRALVSASVLLTGAFLSYLRVLANRHTPAQVMVGALLGGVDAVVCRALLQNFLANDGTVVASKFSRALPIATAAMSIVFGVSVRKRWMKGEPS